MQRLNPILFLILAAHGLAAAENSPFWNESPYHQISRIFATNSPAVGERLPDIVIHDRNGKDIALRSLKGKLTVIVFGCLSCPNFTERNEAYEGLRRDYEPKGAKFYFVYKSLAHFERNGFVNPFSLKERLMHIRIAEKRLEAQIPWLCDNMQNEMAHQMGKAPNSEFIISPDGKVLRKRAWSNVRILRHDLEELLGPVRNPTIPDNQYYQFKPPARTAPAGLVTRLEALRHFRPLIVKPEQKPDELPYYAKLRVDADPQLLTAGKGDGQLYLGFFLDPIYHVHWNNRAAPIQVQIEAPPGMEIDPKQLRGPQPKHDTDVDPREFLVNLKATNLTQPIKITVRYYACNDAEGWCVPLTQKYIVHMKRDPDGGKPLGRMLNH